MAAPLRAAPLVTRSEEATEEGLCSPALSAAGQQECVMEKGMCRYRTILPSMSSRPRLATKKGVLSS